MITRIIALTTIMIVAAVTPAAAYIQVNWPDGSVSYLSEGAAFFWFLVLVVGIGAVFALTSASSGSAEALNPTESVQSYDDEAAKLRAMSRKLDAETDLAENLIKAKRTQAELDEIEKMFSTKTKRQR